MMDFHKCYYHNVNLKSCCKTVNENIAKVNARSEVLSGIKISCSYIGNAGHAMRKLCITSLYNQLCNKLKLCNCGSFLVIKLQTFRCDLIYSPPQLQSDFHFIVQQFTVYCCPTQLLTSVTLTHLEQALSPTAFVVTSASYSYTCVPEMNSLETSTFYNIIQNQQGKKENLSGISVGLLFVLWLSRVLPPACSIMASPSPKPQYFQQRGHHLMLHLTKGKTSHGLFSQHLMH